MLTLGTGGAYENPARRGPATAVALGRRVLLVDAGRGVAESLRAAKLPVAQPDTLLLTHLLPENTVAARSPAVDRLARGHRQTPLRVIGPPGTRALVEGVADAHAGTIAALGSRWACRRRAPRPPRFEVEGGWSESEGGLWISAAGPARRSAGRARLALRGRSNTAIASYVLYSFQRIAAASKRQARASSGPPGRAAALIESPPSDSLQPPSTSSAAAEAGRRQAQRRAARRSRWRGRPRSPPPARACPAARSRAAA